MWRSLFPPRRHWLRKAVKQMALREPEFFTQGFSSPRYEINEHKDKFEVVVDVPGVNAKDIRVNLDQEGTRLTLSGERESKDDTYEFASKFSQSFSLDSSIEVDKLTADLKNGVLTVSAPKDLSKLEEMTRSIPVNDLSGSNTVDVAKEETDKETKN